MKEEGRKEGERRGAGNRWETKGEEKGKIHARYSLSILKTKAGGYLPEGQLRLYSETLQRGWREKH